jgi:hypothetical protein
VACKGERHGLIWRWVLWVRARARVFFLFSLVSSSCMCELNPRMRWRFMSGTLPKMREPFMTKGPIFGKEVYVFLLCALIVAARLHICSLGVRGTEHTRASTSLKHFYKNAAHLHAPSLVFKSRVCWNCRLSETTSSCVY